MIYDLLYISKIRFQEPLMQTIKAGLIWAVKENQTRWDDTSSKYVIFDYSIEKKF